MAAKGHKILSITTKVDSQPLTEAFGFAHQKEKALNGLRGILCGVVADEELNEKELLFLDTWLKSQHYLTDHDDVVSILQQVGDILQDGVITPAELASMQSAIEELVVGSPDGSEPGLGRVDELVGFLTGVASDGVLNDQEVDALVYDAPVLQHFSAHDGQGQYKVVGEVFQALNYGVALQQNSPYREPINAALLTLYETGKYNDIYQKWFR